MSENDPPADTSPPPEPDPVPQDPGDPGLIIHTQITEGDEGDPGAIIHETITRGEDSDGFERKSDN